MTPGEYEVTVSAPGYAASSKLVEVSDNGHNEAPLLNFQLKHELSPELTPDTAINNNGLEPEDAADEGTFLADLLANNAELQNLAMDYAIDDTEDQDQGSMDMYPDYSESVISLQSQWLKLRFGAFLDKKNSWSL